MQACARFFRSVKDGCSRLWKKCRPWVKPAATVVIVFTLLGAVIVFGVPALVTALVAAVGCACVCVCGCACAWCVCKLISAGIELVVDKVIDKVIDKVARTTTQNNSASQPLLKCVSLAREFAPLLSAPCH
ncbi:hypothetical protein COHA_009165 [Chlorella ohadii]|uniref:Uncharacterized protein n=1 Tax=Chlorella ohadii TaxID=2649997 RepID=A0AAD5DIJ6_9CHLO|nr:hypothetical protein COHA_009165 [Chlorella ohadii]